MSVTDELLTNNARYAATFTGPLPLPHSVRGFVFDVGTGRLTEVV